MFSEHALLVGSYDYRLVSLSVVIATFASYAALDLADRLTIARGSARFGWLAGGAGAMGLGIWSIHYIGMLAFRLPIPVWYDWPTVLLSLSVAIFASSAALHVASGHEMSLRRTLSGSIVMGAGMGAMHYLGMGAMRMSAMCHFDPFVVVLSVILAVLISFVALRRVFLARNHSETRRPRNIASAIVMGASIPVVHYTGMAAASFTVSDQAPDLSHAVAVSTLGLIGIAAVTVMILGIAILTSAYHRLVHVKSTMRTRALSARIRALRAAMTTFCIMVVFEVAKQVLHPRVSIWTSHIVTILFATLVAAVLSFTVLRKEERLYFELSSSEKRHRLLFERNLAGVYRTTLAGRFLDCNAAFYQILGYESREEMQAHPSNDIYLNSADRDKFIAKLQSENGLTNFESRLRRKDGSTIWVQENVTLVPSEDGSDPVIEGTMTDISERKRAEEGLRRLAAIVESSDDAMISMDLDGVIHSWNNAAERLFGHSAEEAMGHHITLIVPPDRQHEETTILDRLKRGEQVEHLETVRTRRDGMTVDVALTISPVKDSAGRVVGASKVSRDISERKQAEEALRQAEEKYRALFEDAIMAIFQSTAAGRYMIVNPAMAHMLGYDSPQDLVESITDIPQPVYVDPKSREELQRLLIEQGTVRNFECQIYRKDGSTMWISANVRAVYKAGVMVGYEGLNEDITQRKLLEDQLRQSQKMEAVGLLAGGIAHDFNNALGVITGYSDLLQSSLPPETPSHRHAGEIAKAGRRAAALTRQLLAFSRKQVIQPVVLDLNSATRELERMLRRLIGEHIEITFQRDSALGPVKMDPGQMEQVLMNLCVNARDAMPDGGKLCIQTANVELDETYAKQTGFVLPGSYVMLSVSDTGCGIERDNQRRIFEPFFTTKEPGKGTGLGLSTVYGIAKQNGGYIIVYSEIEKGSTFRLYLPRLGVGAKLHAEAPLPEAVAVGIETVIVVEDEEALRILARTCLESNGYTVLDAPDAATALRLAENDGRRIDLLLSDVVMPGMGGRDLANRMQVLHPNVKVLFMSGYTNDLIDRHRVLEPGTELLEKPFTLYTLLSRVGKVLHGVEGSKAVAATSAS